MKNILKNILFLCSFLSTAIVQAQYLPTVPVPQMHNPANIQPGLNRTTINPHSTQDFAAIQRRNQAIIREVEEHQEQIRIRQERANAIQDLKT